MDICWCGSPRHPNPGDSFIFSRCSATVISFYKGKPRCCEPPSIGQCTVLHYIVDDRGRCSVPAGPRQFALSRPKCIHAALPGQHNSFQCDHILARESRQLLDVSITVMCRIHSWKRPPCTVRIGAAALFSSVRGTALNN